MSAPSGARLPAIQRLRAVRPSGAGRNQVQRAPSSSAASGLLALAQRDRHRASRAGRDARGDELGSHAAGGIAGRRLAAHRHDLVGDALNYRNVRCGGVAARVGGVQAIDVRQQHQGVCADHLRHARGQAVVVAEADLGGGDGVVLVDDGDAAEAQQRRDGGARIEVAPAVLGILEGEQQLGGVQPVAGQCLLPGAGQADLADRGGGLLFLQPQRPARQAERAARQRDGAGGDHHHLRTARAQGCDIRRDGGEPGGAWRCAGLIDHQRGADLDDDALRGGEGREGSHGARL